MPATRVKIEVAIIKEGLTYHLKTDLVEFVLIPPNDGRGQPAENPYMRVFTAYQLIDFTANMYGLELEALLSCPLTVRVRMHATHPYTGFGRYYEELFHNVASSQAG